MNKRIKEDHRVLKVIKTLVLRWEVDQTVLKCQVRDEAKLLALFCLVCWHSDSVRHIFCVLGMILWYLLGKYEPNTASGKGAARIASDIQTTDDLDEGESIFGGTFIVSINMCMRTESQYDVLPH